MLILFVAIKYVCATEYKIDCRQTVNWTQSCGKTLVSDKMDQ